MNCASNFCESKKVSPQSENLFAITPCEFCKDQFYCSVKCRATDWELSHKSVCKRNRDFYSKINEDREETSSASESFSSAGSAKRTVNDYEFIYKNNKQMELGKGSYGSVKLVKDKKSNELFAMKIMSKKSIYEYSTVENLKREIKIQKRLQHPHVTKLFHYFEDKEHVYLILEYAENGSLFHYLRRRKHFPENEAFVYFFQTCLGIDYLHKKNIIHRDLKPENLLLDKQGNIKICDFGWSAENYSTQRSTFCGTIDYMAPEMIKNQQHDHRLDIWCLGVFLYELIHGFAPFKGKNDQEKCHNIISKIKITFDSQVSPLAQDLIEGILKTNPGERLTLDEIFVHQWLLQYEKVYKIKINNYIWRDERKAKAEQVSPASTQTASTIKVMKEVHTKPLPKEQKDSFVLCKNISELKVQQQNRATEERTTTLLTDEDLGGNRKTNDSGLDIDKYIRDLNLDKSKEMSLLNKLEKHCGSSNEKVRSNSLFESNELDHKFINQSSGPYLEPNYIKTRGFNPMKTRPLAEQENGRKVTGSQIDFNYANLKNNYNGINKSQTMDVNGNIEEKLLQYKKEKNKDKTYSHETPKKQKDPETNATEEVRMSRMSARNMLINKSLELNKLKVEKKEPQNFLEKFLIAFGCVKREKEQN